MEREIQLSISMRLSRRADRSSHSSHSKNAESGFFSSGKLPSDCPMKIIWKGGFIRLVLVDGIVWMVLFFIVLLFHVWSCQSSNSFFSAQHKHHRNIYEEADANKRRKGYARPLIDLHMKIYGYEGLEPWSVKKSTVSDVPEGAVIIGGHTAINNLFICLWFNEVDIFTPRDQLSIGCVVFRLGVAFKSFMFSRIVSATRFSQERAFIKSRMGKKFKRVEENRGGKL